MQSDDQAFDPSRPISASNLPPEFRLSGNPARQVLEQYAQAVGVTDPDALASLTSRGVSGVLELLTIEGALLNEENERLAAQNQKHDELVAQLRAEVKRLQSSHDVLSKLVPALDYRDGCRAAHVHASQQGLADSHYLDVLSAARMLVATPAASAQAPAAKAHRAPVPQSPVTAKPLTTQELLSSLRKSPSDKRALVRGASAAAGGDTPAGHPATESKWEEALPAAGGPFVSVPKGSGSYACQGCGELFVARVADRKRGWARFCSKSCKARKQEARTGQHAEFLSKLRG